MIASSIRSNKTAVWLFAVILLEGFVVLSAEMIAIRQTLPFLGSGTDTISIIIAAVLVPLAFGYYRGGEFFQTTHGGRRASVRKKLTQNIALSLPFLTVGLSCVALDLLYGYAATVPALQNRLVLASLYALLFLVIPIYALGQTVPLISSYFRKGNMPHMTGQILCVSTLGSFLGAIVTTVLLMNMIGVSATLCCVVICLAVALFIIAGRRQTTLKGLALLSVLICLGLNSPPAVRSLGIVQENAYSTVQIERLSNGIVNIAEFRVNGAYSSSLNEGNPAQKTTRISQYVDQNFIKSFERAGVHGDVLVIGAGGFITGWGDDWNAYTYVDIDPDLQKTAERYFLKRPLQSNQSFVPMPARAFLQQTTKQYDLVFLDIARGISGAPEHLMTQEFFQQIKKVTKPGGMVLLNIFASKTFKDDYTHAIDATIRSVFPAASRQVLQPVSPWDAEGDYASIIYFARAYQPTVKIYTDDKNSIGLERKPQFLEVR